MLWHGWEMPPGITLEAKVWHQGGRSVVCLAKPLISGGVLGDSVVFSFGWANWKVGYLGAWLIGETEINVCGKELCLWASILLGCWWKLEICDW